MNKKKFGNRLPDSIRTCVSDFRTTSWDKENNVYMTESTLPVLNFDLIAKKHRDDNAYIEPHSSNDAYYVTHEGHRYFIEFKNGKIKAKKINAKATASVLLAIDMGLFQDFHDVQDNCSYILVYNEEKHPPSAQVMDDFLHQLSCQSRQLEQVQSIRWIYKNVTSLTKKEFEQEFIKKIVEPEYLVAGE